MYGEQWDLQEKVLPYHTLIAYDENGGFCSRMDLLYNGCYGMLHSYWSEKSCSQCTVGVSAFKISTMLTTCKAWSNWPVAQGQQA